MNTTERIREVRKSRQCSQEELGKKIGVSRATINSIERSGDNISIKRLLEISDALSCDPSYFVTGNGKADPIIHTDGGKIMITEIMSPPKNLGSKKKVVDDASLREISSNTFRVIAAYTNATNKLKTDSEFESLELTHELRSYITKRDRLMAKYLANELDNDNFYAI